MRNSSVRPGHSLSANYGSASVEFVLLLVFYLLCVALEKKLYIFFLSTGFTDIFSM